MPDWILPKGKVAAVVQVLYHGGVLHTWAAIRVRHMYIVLTSLLRMQSGVRLELPLGWSSVTQLTPNPTSGQKAARLATRAVSTAPP